MRIRITMLLAIVAVMLGGVFSVSGPVGALAQGDKVTICHKPDTPAEGEISVSVNALDAHLAHGDFEGPCVPPVEDIIIDADGIASAGVGGSIEVFVGALLSGFPSSGDTGLDMFDNNQNGAFDPGIDDLHSEGSACPTGFRDSFHQLGVDCKIVDLDGSLFDGQQVNCDLEFFSDFTGFGCPTNVLYYDANGNGIYDIGEDLILDVNGTGVYD